MTTRMKSARKKLHTRLLASAGELISIAPVSGGEHPDIAAVRSRTGQDLRGHGGVEVHRTSVPGMVVTAQAIDWAIDSDDLPDGYRPSQGDVITDEGGDVFSVQANPASNRLWRWSSPAHQVLRLHTKPKGESL